MGVVLLTLLIIIPSASSWGYMTHEWFCERLYENNKDLRELITNKEEFLRGCIAPDKEYDDQNNHHCYAAAECKKINTSSINPGTVVYFEDIKSCINNEYFDCPTLIKFDESVKNATVEDFSFYLGVSTHYITDAHVPVHQIMGEDYYGCHAPFERKINEKLERDEKDWVVTENCDIYFPCKKTGKTVRKCDNPYNVDVVFSYEDILKVLKNTDSTISKKLNISEGSYENLYISGRASEVSFDTVTIITLAVILVVLILLFLRK